MIPKRADRVGDLIREVLSEMLIRDLSDPRLEAVTIIDVTVSPDLRLATVHFSAMGNPQREEESLHGLESASGCMKKKLGKELRLRYTPDLLFRVDHSFEYGSKIDRLIQNIHQEEKGDSQEDR